jgi:hypothetical protein
MALSDCPKCWDTPCTCGYEFRNSSPEYKETMTKSINGFTIEDVFKWLADKDYLTDEYKEMYEEFKQDKKK